MLLVHPVQELIRYLVPLISVVVVGSSNHGGSLWSLPFIGLAIAIGMLRWFTTTYRVTPQQVQVRRGLVRRRLLSVPLDRVRSVDLSSHLLHRALGLARVTVGTGESDRKKPELKLDALTVAEAERLRDDLLHRAPTGEPTGAAGATGSDGPATPRAKPVETVIATMKPAWVRYGPFTLSGLVAIGFFGALLSQVMGETHWDPTRAGPLPAIVRHLQSSPVPVAVLEVLVAAAALIALLSTGGYVLSFWNFRLARLRVADVRATDTRATDTHGDEPASASVAAGNTLHVTRGLITSRATTIEERRLRGVELSEPLLLRAVGGARLIAITTGLRVGRGAGRGGSLLLPPAPKAEAIRVAGLVVPGADRDVTAPLLRHPARARRRRHIRALTVAVVLTAALLVLTLFAGWPSSLWTLSLLTWPLAALLAEDRYRSLGHALIGRRLVTRSGSVVRRHNVLADEGVIGVTIQRTFFQRRAGLATLVVTTAAGRQHYEVWDVEPGEACALAHAIMPDVLTPFLDSPADLSVGVGVRA
jgi:putative membrane protein